MLFVCFIEFRCKITHGIGGSMKKTADHKHKRVTLSGLILEKKKLLAVFIISTLILSVVAPVKSYIMQWLIDAPSKTAAIQYLLLGIGIILLSHITEYISRFSFMKIACRNIEQIRNRLIDRQIKKPMQVYLSENTGSVLSCLTNDMRLIFDEYYMSIFNILMWGGMMLVALLMLGMISPALLMIALVLGMAPLLAPKILAEKMSRLREEYSKNIAAYTSRTGELLKGFEALLTSGGTRYLTENHRAAAADNREKEYKMQWMLNIAAIMSSLVAWIPSITVLLFGVFLVYDGKITIGYLVTANMLTNFVISPCRQVSDAYAKLKSSRIVKEKIEEAMNQEIKAFGTEEIDRVDHIRAEHLTFAYPDAEAPSLCDVSLDIRRGEKIALVGPSGSGKSTIAKILYRYFEDYQGDIFVNDKPLKSINLESYYQKTAMIPQTPFLFSDSIYNNLCLFQSFSDDEVREAVRLAGLETFIKDQPDGWDTVLAENGRNLSGGQAQRIAMARAILRRCDLMLVDEATSSLDVATTCEVMDNLLDLDCTVIMITHDIFGEYMKRFDRIYYLEQGRVKEKGIFDGLMKENGGFYCLYHRMDS